MSEFKSVKKNQKEDSQVFAFSNFFEQWKICCSNWKFLLKKDNLVSMESRTTYNFVSTDLHEFQMGGIITPTRKILSMMYKISHSFWYLSFMVYPKNISCGSNYAANMTFVKVDRNNIITRFIILFSDKSHFRTKILF